MIVTQTLNVTEARWSLPGSYRVLVNGYQSWSEAELRNPESEQSCPSIPALIAQGQEQMAQLMQQMAQPKQSMLKIEKQPDGSFVGTKVEQ